ncbi:MAG: hypothetical protein R6U38_10710, partial [Desulfatiglandaceae bacterium]
RHVGMSELDLERDQSAESFFAEAMPKGSAQSKGEKSIPARNIYRRKTAPQEMKVNAESK